jgi:hypothetical protein
MSETPRDKRATDKSPYVKPSMKRVQLKPDEAVLGNCKTTISTGSGQTPCHVTPNPCNVAGS